MQMGIARVLLLALAACSLVGCATTSATSAPRHDDAQREREVERQQRELEERRLQLEGQVLAELRKLRESRQASTGPAEPAGDDDSGDSTTECELLIFGGAAREVFLGCLTEEQRSDSVFNMIGEHGADDSPVSIRNKFAPYGSNYDDTSACNGLATHPPVVLTSEGKSLGLLTTNMSLKRRITAPSVSNWLTRMCRY
jgi:hypothetical protein